MVEQLKACPFCGGPALKPDNQAKPGKSSIWEISCYQYCVSMRRATRREAIAAWNHRADDGLRDALEALDTVLGFDCPVDTDSEFPEDLSALNAAFKQARAALEAKDA